MPRMSSTVLLAALLATNPNADGWRERAETTLADLLAGGVTGVRDMAGDARALRPLAEATARVFIGGAALLLVAVVGDRDALDQFHHEVGPAGCGGPGIEHLCNVGVIHQGQRLALGLEAGDHLLRVHPQLDDLQRHLAAYGLFLLGHVHHGHAAFADPLLDHAAEMVIERGRASVVLLQRRLDIGYTRASRLVEALEQEGLVGPLLESGSREVLMSREEWEALTATL